MNNELEENLEEKQENYEVNATESKSAKNITVKKKNILIISIIIFIVIIAVVAGVLIRINSVKKATEEYKANAHTFTITVLSSLADMEKVGNDISSYWHDYIFNKKYTSVNDAVSKALNKNVTLVGTVKQDKSKIEAQYQLLLKLPNETDSELIEIKDAVKELYDAYYDFYDTVITPSGSYIEFNAAFSEIDNRAIKKYNNLKNLLEY